MPAKLEMVDSTTYADAKLTGLPRTLRCGRAQQLRSIYLVNDWSTATGGIMTLLSAAEFIGNITIKYGDQLIQMHGYDLYNTMIGFYRSQGVLTGTVTSEQYGDNPNATVAVRGAFRIPVGAPAANGFVETTIDLAGYAAWASGTPTSATGSVYLFADFAASPYEYSCWNTLTAGLGTTPVMFTPVNYGKYFMGLGAVMGITLGTAIANGTADATNCRGGNVAATNNYEDDLRSLEIRNVDIIHRADAPLAQPLYHSGRLLGLLKQGEGTASIDGTSSKSWPSGHYWAEGDAQEITDNFRVYLSCITATTDVSVSVWTGTPVEQGSKTETKDAAAPTPGQPSGSVPVPRSANTQGLGRVGQRR